MLSIQEMLERAKANLAGAIDERSKAQSALVELRGRVDDGDTTVTDSIVTAAIQLRDSADSKIDAAKRAVDDLEKEVSRETELKLLQERSVPAAPMPSYDAVGRVQREERTYAAHKERGFDGEVSGRPQFRAGSKPGADFERDVIAAWMDDYEARERLGRHIKEERIERSKYYSRAAGTGAFAGLTVPQYLTDLYAPAVSASRPFADAIKAGGGGHILPEEGMTVNLSRITTSTSVALQTEGSAVSETNADDTLLSISVLTAAGQQTITRQALQRSTGVEPIILEDLYRRNAALIDATLITGTTNGLSTVATAVTYTDASPTAAELYPKVLEGLSGVEAALLDQASGATLALMHSRRWYWMQSQVGTTFPFIAQPDIPAQQGGVVLPSGYGSGARGRLPNGTVVVVDNNVPTNLGAGTNEDEIYLVDPRECHLWEDPSAPMFIRAEQAAAASLGVLLVVYSYFAYTHARQPHARRISGTGLVTPTF